MIRSGVASALIAVAVVAAPRSPAAATKESLTPVALRCDWTVDPLGVDSSPPRLSWQLEGDGVRGRRQTARQILVSASGERLLADQGEVWNSGRVASDEQLHVPYGGRRLRSAEQVFWKVRVWDDQGRASGWSAPARWTMGVLEPADWKGRWITDAELLRWSERLLADRPEATVKPPATPRDNPHANDTLLLRRRFDVRAGLRRALANVCGLGHYEMTVNGARVGTGLLTPGWTTYDKTCLYDTYDVTPSLRAGANAVGLMLGSGMYSVQEGRYFKFLSAVSSADCGRRRSACEYEDGAVDVVGTDGRWRVAPGPIVFSNVYGGEDHDARRDPRGWDQPGFDDASWAAAVVNDAPGRVLRGASHVSPAFRTFETFAPVAVHPLGPGVAVYDFGQNASMMPRLRVRGPAGGARQDDPGRAAEGGWLGGPDVRRRRRLVVELHARGARRRRGRGSRGSSITAAATCRWSAARRPEPRCRTWSGWRASSCTPTPRPRASSPPRANCSTGSGPSSAGRSAATSPT